MNNKNNSKKKANKNSGDSSVKTGKLDDLSTIQGDVVEGKGEGDVGQVRDKEVSAYQQTKKDPAYYLRCLQRGKTQKEAKILAGYSPKTKHSVIMATKGVRQSVANVSEARMVNQARPGHQFVDNTDRLVEIADDQVTPQSVKIQAIKEHNVMSGYNAPSEIKTQNLSMLIELSDLSAQHLEYILEHGID